MSELTVRKPPRVTIGNYVYYCDSFRLNHMAAVRTESAVDGKSVINSVRNCGTRVEIKCRVYNEDMPMLDGLTLSNVITRNNFKITYRGIEIPGCVLAGCDLVDNGEDYCELTITAVSSSTIFLE